MTVLRRHKWPPSRCLAETRVTGNVKGKNWNLALPRYHVHSNSSPTTIQYSFTLSRLTTQKKKSCNMIVNLLPCSIYAAILLFHILIHYELTRSIVLFFLCIFFGGFNRLMLFIAPSNALLHSNDHAKEDVPFFI